MRNKLLIIIFLIGLSMNAITVSNINMELVATYPVNNGENSFTNIILKEDETVGIEFIPGPIYMQFVDNILVIEDTPSKRNIYLDSEFKIHKVLNQFDEDNISFETFNGFKFLYNNFTNELKQYDEKWKLINHIDINDLGIKYLTNYLLFNDILFLWDGESNLYSISILEDFYLKDNLKDTDETIKRINAIKLKSLEWSNFDVDKSGRVLINGQLISRKYSDHYFYWQNKTPSKFNMNRNSVKNLDSNYRFLGTDKYFLEYWSASNYILVIDSFNGNKKNLFNAIGYDFKFATVDENGNIYFFNYDEKNAYLYSVKRQW